MDNIICENPTTLAVRIGPQMSSATTKMSRSASCEKRKADLIKIRASSERFSQQTIASRAVGGSISTTSTYATCGG